MTAPTRHLLACAATAAVTLGLLAGCTGGTPTSDPTPTAAPTSAPPSATPTATAVAPQWTVAMDEVSPSGATAVLEYFLTLYPYVVNTGDTVEWDRLSHPECLFCSDVSRRFGGQPADSTAPLVKLSFISANELDPGVYFSIQVALDETLDNGAVTSSIVHAGVIRDGNSWQIRAVEIEPAPTPDA